VTETTTYQKRPPWRHRALTPAPQELERKCIVCPDAVFDDPTRELAGTPLAPVRMPDRRYTHERCKSRYWEASERLEALMRAEAGAWLDGVELGYLGTATSAQADRVERERDALYRGDAA
jgi:hypothetical protein